MVPRSEQAMKSIFFYWALLGAVAFVAVPPALAHPGRTDSSGCHTCRTNCSKWGLRSGQYHCHGGGSRSGSSRISRPRTPPPPPPPSPPPPVRVLTEDEATGRSVSENSIVLLREESPRQRIWVDVLAVVDGDTFVARQGERLYLMQLRDVEAPEVDQPFGIDARQRLDSVLNSQRVLIEPGAGDGCVVPVVAGIRDGHDVSQRLLLEGFLWATPSAPDSLRRLEQSARAHRVGLWRGSTPEPPWEHRRRKSADESHQ